MPIRPFSIPHAVASVTLSMMAALLLAGCGGSEEVVNTRLPENIMVHPRGHVAVITPSASSTGLTTMQALGVGARVLSPDSITPDRLRPYPVLILEENALSDKRMLGTYPIITEHVKSGATLLLMQQDPEVMKKLRERYTDMITPRGVDYELSIVPARRDDMLMNVLNYPNGIGDGDLDSLSRYASQIAAGGDKAQAVLAASVMSPESTAALLWEPYGRGAIWYSSVKLTPRAALGYAAEQKLMANLLSAR